MKIEETKKRLRRAESELRQAEIVMEMHENGLRELKEDIKKLKAIINKKDNWRLVEAPDSWQKLYEEKALLMSDMMHFAYVRNEGWVPDWYDAYQIKHGLSYDGDGQLRVFCSELCNDYIFGIVVKSQEIGQEMLEEFGKRIEKIYNKQY